MKGVYFWIRKKDVEQQSYCIGIWDRRMPSIVFSVKEPYKMLKLSFSCEDDSKETLIFLASSH